MLKPIQSVAVLTAATFAAISTGSIAQDTAPDDKLQEVVITGTTRPVEAIRSSNAISLFNEAALQQLDPQSVGELVRSIPGFHAEDSGGEVGNNITPRGFPLTKQAQFTALQRDGMNVYYDQGILFAQADRFTRLSNSSAARRRSAAAHPRYLWAARRRATSISFARRPRRGRRNRRRRSVRYQQRAPLRVRLMDRRGVVRSNELCSRCLVSRRRFTRSPGFTANREARSCQSEALVRR